MRNAAEVASPDDSSSSSLPQDEWIDRLCNRFEEAWLAGNRPKIDEFAGEAPLGEWPELLRELLVVELHYRRQLGEAPTLDDYRRAYPALDFAPLADLFAAGRPLHTFGPYESDGPHDPTWPAGAYRQCARGSTASATTNCSRRSPAAAWAWFTRPARSAWAAPWR